MFVMLKDFSHTHDWMNEDNNYVMNVGLWKDLLNRTLMNEWETLR